MKPLYQGETIARIELARDETALLIRALFTHAGKARANDQLDEFTDAVKLLTSLRLLQGLKPMTGVQILEQANRMYAP